MLNEHAYPAANGGSALVVSAFTERKKGYFSNNKWCDRPSLVLKLA